MTKTRRAIDENGCLECSKCKAAKPVSEFSPNKLTPTGYNYICRDCHREYVRAGYQAHKESTLAKKAEYREENRAKRREDDRSYYLRNKEKFRAKYNREISVASRTVQAAVARGELPKVTTMYCVRCMRPAHNYHHQSYLKSDRLCVVPVCRSCHRNMNKQRYGETIRLGIVSTNYGLVRIAIAGLE